MSRRAIGAGSFARSSVKLGAAKTHEQTQGREGRRHGSGNQRARGEERQFAIRQSGFDNQAGNGFGGQGSGANSGGGRHHGGHHRPENQQGRFSNQNKGARQFPQPSQTKPILVGGKQIMLEEPLIAVEGKKEEKKDNRYFGKSIIGCDVGATKILAAAFSPDGKIVAQVRINTPKRNRKLLTDAITSAIDRLGMKRAEGIGVCVPGFVQDGTVYGLPNLGLDEKFDMRMELSEKLGKRVNLENDSKCFAIAESAQGAAKGQQNALIVNFGSGIGGGIVINSKLYRGAKNQAGEIGHMKTSMAGPKCGCGGEGCWERYSSGTGIVERFADAINEGKKSFLFPETVEAQQVLESGDEACVFVSRLAARHAGRGIASLVNVLNPSIVVVGGPVGEAYLQNYKKEFFEGYFEAALPVVKNTPVVKAKLENASLIGAKLIAKSSEQR